MLEQAAYRGLSSLFSISVKNPLLYSPLAQVGIFLLKVNVFDPIRVKASFCLKNSILQLCSAKLNLIMSKLAR